eukprot:TRINITY_DN10030_c0_g1_i2.p1 TRINITY_DN10030_c0_g1~~TRINITY_DN10030_c0_g1_i2.p1  ORF type:complete len:652 (+),score=128.95 TRINITY_DN10030_c0_g1_i2:35-1990(+)
MDLYVRIGNERHIATAQYHDTVKQFRAAVKEACKVDDLQLWFEGEELQDDSTMGTLNLVDGDELVGGSEKAEATMKLKALSITINEESLTQAVIKGLPVITRGLLLNGIPPRPRMLLHAINKNHYGIAAMLLEFKTPPNAAGLMGFRSVVPLELALTRKNIELTQLLLERGADPNLEMGDQNNALCFALSKSLASSFLHMLIDYGAQHSSASWRFSNALTTAVVDKNLEAVQMLVSKGARVNSKGVCGVTPLHTAIDAGFLPLVDFFISAGADLNPRTNVSPLSLAVKVTSSGDAIVKKLLDCKCDPNDGGVGAKVPVLPPIEVACQYNKVQHLSMLVEYGAELPRSALSTAVVHGSVDVVVALLDNFSDHFNLADPCLVHKAVNRRRLVMAEFLVDRGAHVESLPTGQSLVASCLEFFPGSMPLLTRLIKEGAEVTGYDLLHVLRYHGHPEAEDMAIHLVDHSDVNVVTTDNCTPLYIAIDKRMTRLIQKLLSKADIDLSLGKKGPLPLAAFRGDIDSCIRLVTAGVAVEASTKKGNSGLILAAKQGHLEVVRFFINEKPKLVHQYGSARSTALIHAARWGHGLVVEFLIANGACVNWRNSVGKTALSYAAKYNHDEVITHLLNHGANPCIRDNNGDLPVNLTSLRYLFQ